MPCQPEKRMHISTLLMNLLIPPLSINTYNVWLKSSMIILNNNSLPHPTTSSIFYLKIAPSPIFKNPSKELIQLANNSEFQILLTHIKQINII